MTDAVILRPSPKQAMALQSKAFEILYGGARGGGKALWARCPVLTPSGFCRMADLIEGHHVIDPSTGLPTRVIGVYPQGVQQIFEVAFADGGRIYATLDHLWVYRTVLHPGPDVTRDTFAALVRKHMGGSPPSGGRWDRWRLGTTAQMIAALAENSNVWVPISEPIYQDGSDEGVDALYCGGEVDVTAPLATLEVRAEILKRVVSESGVVTDNGGLLLTLASAEVAGAVVNIARSLGGKARQNDRSVRLWFPRPEFLFCGEKPGRGAIGFARQVVSIQQIAEDDAICIAVDNPRGLFVAGDYVVTHNTWAGMAWLLRHIDKPHYRSMVIRRNATDLREWEDKAREMYAPFGAKFTGKPSTIRWPSGAVTYTGHLSDAHAWESVQGWEIQNLVLEEAGQIPDEERYLRLIGSLRSKFDDVPTQVLLTANPGGPGHGWLKRRFIDARDHKKRFAEPYVEFDPDGKGRRTRVFIPALVDDNPVLLQNDPGYIDYLDSLPPALQRAWRYGDWDAFEGAFFSEFRAHHIPGEPPEACHVVHPCELPWFAPRWMSLDWGYSHNCAALWFARNEDGRIHVYREFVTRGVGAEELGVRLAETTLPDLERMPGHSMVLSLSPDAFARRDDRNTVAQQLTVGLGMVLGPEAVFLVDATEEERSEHGVRVWDAVQQRQEAQREKIRIAVRRANNDRVGGWNYLRQLLRWWPLREKSTKAVDYSIVRDILKRPNGPEEYAKYLASLAAMDEVLPRLVIHSCCPRVIEGLQRAQYDAYNKEDVQKQDGDDEIDSLRYGVMAHRKDDAMLPRSVHLARRMDEEVARHGYLTPHSLVMIARAKEAEYKRTSSQSGIRPGRGIRGRRVA